MDTQILKPEVIKRIKTDGLLFGQVCDAVGVVPGSLTRLLNRNHKKLRQKHVLVIIKKGLGIQDNSELLEMQEENIIHD